MCAKHVNKQRELSQGEANSTSTIKPRAQLVLFNQPASKKTDSTYSSHTSQQRNSGALDASHQVHASQSVRWCWWSRTTFLPRKRGRLPVGQTPQLGFASVACSAAHCVQAASSISHHGIEATEVITTKIEQQYTAPAHGLQAPTCGLTSHVLLPPSPPTHS